MGEVYRAHDARLNREVAIKILPASSSANPECLQRFAQESCAAAALNHPNILSIFDIGDDRGNLMSSPNYWKAKPCAADSEGTADSEV
jgi:eukaryotic-like serine/threonine-protein kinase